MRNRLIVVCGFRGSGKTTAASRIVRDKPGVFAFDPHGDPVYDWVPNTARSAAAFDDYMRRWARVAKPERFLCRYIPDGRDDPHDALDFFCSEVWGWRNVWVVVEEVSEAVGSPSAAAMPPELRRVVNQGRHRGLNQIYTGLRYAELPRPITAGADVQVIFATREPVDLDALNRRIGSGATEAVQKLGRHDAIVFFSDRSFEVVSSREPGIAELVMRDSARGERDRKPLGESERSGKASQGCAECIGGRGGRMSASGRSWA